MTSPSFKMGPPDSLAGRTVFVAGGTCAAGASVISRLLDTSDDVRVRAVYHTTQPVIKHERLEHVQADLRNPAECAAVADGCHMAVMTAASSGGAKVHNTAPWKLVNDNLLMNSTMLEAFHVAGVDRVVFVGSSTVYQEFDGLIAEDALDLNLEPNPAYAGVGWCMRFLEKLCLFWHQTTGMEFGVVRAANIYGPFSRFDPETSNVIPALVRKAVDGMNPFEVWGGPGVARDVIYSDDFADGIISMLGAEVLGFEVFNLGTSEPVTVAQIVRWALEASGNESAEVVYTKPELKTVSYRGLDCSKAFEKMQWKASTHPSQGIQKTVNWWKENASWWIK